MILRHGDRGDAVTHLQNQLVAAGFPLTGDGWFGDHTEAAVRAYQRREGLVVDGIAGPRTLAALAGVRDNRHLRDIDIERAARQLEVDIASVHAVAEVESRGAGFLADGRPQILFERHIFRRRLAFHGLDADRYAQRHPDLVNTAPGGYRGGPAEHDRLTGAAAIHRVAAIESASWGRFQIMGFHWEALRYPSAQSFRDAMETTEAAHLEAFVRFIQADNRLLIALRARDWRTFARIYNGPAFEKNNYDARLQSAWERHASTETA